MTVKRDAGNMPAGRGLHWWGASLAWLNISQRSMVILVAALAVGAALRMERIRQPYVDAFSWRQSSTAMIAGNFYRTNPNIFYPQVDWTGPGPGYQGREFQTVTYLASIGYRLFGQRDWIGRGVAIMFGLAGIIALYALVRRAWDEPRALASAWMLAVIPGAIFVDRSFLPDPAMVAFMTAAVWLWLCYLQTRTTGSLIGAGVLGALGGLTKIPGLIVGLPMLYAAVTMRGWRGLMRPRELLPALAGAALILLPVVAYYAWARHLALTYPPHHFAGAGNWLWDLGWARVLEHRFFLPGLANRATIWLWTMPVIVMLGAGLLLRPPRSKREQGTPWLFHWWLVGGAVLFLAGGRELVNNPWNLQILNPAVAALAAHALVTAAVFVGRHASARLSALVIAAALAAVVFYARPRLGWMYHPYAGPGRELGLALREVSEPGDLVVTIADAAPDPVAIFYSERRGWVFPPAHTWGTGVDFPEDADAIEIIEELRSLGARWFGIVTRTNDIDAERPGFARHLMDHTREHVRTADWVIFDLNAGGPKSSASPAHSSPGTRQ